MKSSKVIFLILIAITVGIMFGCAPPPSTQEAQSELSSDQQKALEDSLKQVQLRELKITRSFAYSHYNNRAWSEAAKYYAELADKDTGSVFNDYGKWAQCYIKMDVPPDSVKMVYQRGIAAFPDDAYLHASLGHIFRTQGLLDSAVVHYEAAVEHNGEELEYRKTLAELYTRVNRQMEAIDLYRGILAEEPENKEIADVLADLVRRHLSPEEYVNSLEEAVAQFPDDLDKKYELAKAYEEIGQNEKALAQLEIILAKVPRKNLLELVIDAFGGYEQEGLEYSNPELYQTIRALQALGEVQQNLQKYSAAAKAYQEILKLVPENTEAMVSASNCYREMNNFSQARVYARRALSKNSKLGSAYMALASIYETAADNKSGGEPPTYNDKLVFLVAYGLYQDAKNTGDYSVLENARNHKNYLKESKLIPEYSDWFMHQNETDPTAGGGYDWINTNWSELGYIEKYLKQISEK
ncbi:hypothetical protein CEE37_06515 [candidate division LCP-89 bacterium B3_LCP]|uniref:Uncharacterized protein n=1 Tax=candidate division LCP-89 bacterium B3_LCP TaxID=2012998 RepID=A0A532V073_UNCL8|nr:MAG: hypothetical protein CEE37_06515 [candidate division LCP-89 bacterium B3_LCP]